MTGNTATEARSRNVFLPRTVFVFFISHRLYPLCQYCWFKMELLQFRFYFISTLYRTVSKEDPSCQASLRATGLIFCRAVCHRTGPKSHISHPDTMHSHIAEMEDTRLYVNTVTGTDSMAPQPAFACECGVLASAFSHSNGRLRLKSQGHADHRKIAV